MGFFKKIFSREKKEKLDTGLQKTKTGVWDKISRAVAGKSKVDDEVLDNLEEAFITSDVGVDTTLKIIERLEARVARDKYLGSEELNNLLCEEVTDLLAEDISRAENQELGDFEVPKTGEPYVIMVVGVNGVGKTTTTSNLGIGLAKQGKRVLLIDADAQGSLTASLGFTEPDKLEVTLASVMEKVINDEEMEPGYGILKHEEGIDLMPGNIELSGLEVSLVNVMSREIMMRSYMDMVKEQYDYILIDCMPSLGMITISFHD